MATLLTIGDFSRMTHLSIKALRHYHDTGVLIPAAIDPFSGYRSYDAAQVPAAQVIRRLRDLGMPLDSIRTVLGAADIQTRNRELADHLSRMERQLEQVQASDAALRGLLTGPAVRPDIELRSIPAVTALAVREVMEEADLTGWGAGAFGELGEVLAGGQARAARGDPGALGTLVAERAIGGGRIREYYPVSFADTDDETRQRTEVCWPVFRTSAA